MNKFDKRKFDKRFIVVLSVSVSLLLTSCSINKDVLVEDLDNIGDSFLGKGPRAMDNKEASYEENNVDPIVEGDLNNSSDINDTNEDSIEENAGTEQNIADNENTDDSITSVPLDNREDSTDKFNLNELDSKEDKEPEDIVSRVDFSNLTEVNHDIFSVDIEEFSESLVIDDMTYVTFEGNRLVVDVTDNSNATVAINLLLDGFYKEIEGKYQRCSNEIQSELTLTEEVVSPQCVKVNYSYRTNERVLVVRMEYELSNQDEIIESVNEIYTFDMLTATRIDVSDVCRDEDSLIQACIAKYHDVDVEDYDELVLVPDSEDEFIIWIVIGENIYIEHISHDEVAPYLNRYGKIILEI